MLAIGIDIGGTHTRIGLVSKDGTLVKIKEIPTDLSLNPDAFFKKLTKEMAPFLEKASSLGIGIAGQIEEGYLHFAPNLNWRNIPIKETLHALTGLKVTVENDVRAALIGEWNSGAGRGYNDVILLSLGTGLGGAFISGGTLIRGANHAAGEVGHLCIDFNGPKCSCGSHGCLEAYAGGWAIAKRAKGLAAAKVFEKAKAGEAEYAAIVEEATRALGAGVGSLLNLLNPRCIIFTGGIFTAHLSLIENIKKEAQKIALPIEFQKVEWKMGALEYPGVIGSALASFPLK